MDAIPPISNRESNYAALEVFIDDKSSIAKAAEEKPVRNMPKLTFIVSLICLSSFYYGFSLTYLSTIKNHTLVEFYGDRMKSATMMSILTGAVPVGGIFGSLFANVLLRYFTRRNCLLVINFCALLVNLIIQITNVWVLLVCRLLTGVFVGIYLGIVPLYVHEMCPYSVAGSFGAFTQLAHILGVVVCYLFGMIFDLTNANHEFVLRFQIQFTSLLIIIQTACMLMEIIPQSPNSLIEKDQIGKAREVLLLFQNEDAVEPLLKEKILENEQSEVDKTVENNETQTDEKIQLTFRSGLLGFELPFMQQMSGINFLVTQLTAITALYSVSFAPYSALTGNTIEFIATAASVAVLTRVGRRPLLLAGNAGVGVINIMLGLSFLSLQRFNWEPGYYIAMVFIALFMIWFGLTIGPVVWLYTPEILPTKMVPIATAMSWAGCSICVIVCPIVTSAMGSPFAVFLFLGVLDLIFLVPNILLVVETKGLSPYEIYLKCK